MFPDADYTPVESVKRSIHQEVSLGIRGEFFQPKLAIALRHVGMLGAAMPEAPIDKNDHALTLEREVRSAKQFLIPPPAGDPGGTKQLCQCEFRCLVATSSNTGHHFGTLRFGEDVRH